MITQRLVWAVDGWARVERSPSLRSGIESPLNHPFFFNFMTHPTVISLNLILGAVFRGWHRRHPLGLILGRLIIACLHRILLLNLRINVHVPSGGRPYAQSYWTAIEADNFLTLPHLRQHHIDFSSFSQVDEDLNPWMTCSLFFLRKRDIQYLHKS
jgi:hypothetical protein